MFGLYEKREALVVHHRKYKFHYAWQKLAFTPKTCQKNETWYYDSQGYGLSNMVQLIAAASRTIED